MRGDRGRMKCNSVFEKHWALVLPFLNGSHQMHHVDSVLSTGPINEMVIGRHSGSVDDML